MRFLINNVIVNVLKNWRNTLKFYQWRTLSTTCITRLMSSFALLRVSARTDRDIIILLITQVTSNHVSVKKQIVFLSIKVVNAEQVAGYVTLLCVVDCGLEPAWIHQRHIFMRTNMATTSNGVETRSSCATTVVAAAPSIQCTAHTVKDSI